MKQLKTDNGQAMSFNEEDFLNVNNLARDD
jgi:hypothetical protein